MTIADLAADFRAPTPSAAAELLVTEKTVLVKQVEDLKNRLKSNLQASFHSLRQALSLLSKGLRDPRRELTNSWLHLDDLNHRLNQLMNRNLRHQKKAYISEARALLHNSPLDMISSWKQRVGFVQQSVRLLISRRIKEHQMNTTLVRERTCVK